jgi:hypothetical protein
MIGSPMDAIAALDAADRAAHRGERVTRHGRLPMLWPLPVAPAQRVPTVVHCPVAGPGRPLGEGSGLAGPGAPVSSVGLLPQVLR